jgi:transposase
MAMGKDSVAALGAIGVDLGDKRSQVCVLDKTGELVEECSIPTTAVALERKFAGLPRTRVVLETGTHANWVHDVLVKTGHEVIVANARKLRAISANERKCDRRDARILADLGRTHVRLLSPVAVRPEQVRRDLTLVRSRAALVEIRTALVNSVRGLAKSSGVRLPKCSAESLHKQEIPEPLRQVLAPMLASLEQITLNIRLYDKRIKDLCRASYQQTKLLRQISGVGPVTSLYFALVIGDPRRFRDARDVGAYLGLVPRRDQSGCRDPELRISKSGDRMLRTLLVQGAQYILGRWGPDTDLRRFGKKLAERGGKAAKRRAVVAVARKLAVLLFALLRTGEVYEPLRNSAKTCAS